jgi:hypothetical protein
MVIKQGFWYDLKADPASKAGHEGESIGEYLLDGGRGTPADGGFLPEKIPVPINFPNDNENVCTLPNKCLSVLNTRKWEVGSRAGITSSTKMALVKKNL